MNDRAHILEELKDLKQKIDTALSAFLSSKEATMGVPLTKHGQKALKYLRDFTNRPGKRLRGILAIRTFRQFGGKNREAELQLAIALELAQSYLLIVDDAMDRSLTRRGGPTIHELYRTHLKKTRQRSVAHTSDMLAINVGLLAAHMAAERLASLPEVSSERLVAAQQLFQRNIASTGYGQIDDMFNQIEEDVSEQSILKTNELKSSYYTFVNPMQIGALLAGAGAKDLELIKEFGLPAGVAFQLRDDIMGLFGDHAATGKSAMDDLKEGKMTLLIHYTLERANSLQRTIIHNALGNPNITPEQHREVKIIVESVGARHYTEQLAYEKGEEARHVLLRITWPKANKRFLNSLIDYVIERDT